MSVTNGQPANQTTFNNAFVSKTADNSVVSNIELADVDLTQGATVTQVQRELNALNSWTGKTVNSAKDVKPTWSANTIGSAGDDLYQRVDELSVAVGAVNGLAQLDGSGFVPIAQLPPSIVSAMNYLGAWDASSNSPVLADGGGFTDGDLYAVSVGGSQNLGSGSITFTAGDLVIYNGTIWQKIEGGQVASVNGATGVVVLNVDDINDVTLTSIAAREVLARNSGNTAFVNVNLDSSADDSTAGSSVTLATVATSVVRLTGAVTSINMIPAGFSGQKFVLINRAGASVTINHDTGGTAANRIYTGTGNPLSMADNSALWFEYDSTESRWQCVGGSGSGGGGVGFQETPAGSINGSNVTFGPLTYVPSSDESILVYVDGILLKNTEWSKSGSNIVLSVAPVVGQSIFVFYLTDGSVALPSISGVFKVEYRTISSGEASAKALTLAQTPAVPGEVMLDLIGGGTAFYTDDFTVTGSTLDWNGLGLDGLLTTGDKVRINYVY